MHRGGLAARRGVVLLLVDDEVLIGGQQRYFRAVTPLVAPYVNSYRRFIDPWASPVNLAWAIDNRTVGLRVPDSEPEDRRVENRLLANHQGPLDAGNLDPADVPRMSSDEGGNISGVGGRPDRVGYVEREEIAGRDEPVDGGQADVVGVDEAWVVAERVHPPPNDEEEPMSNPVLNERTMRQAPATWAPPEPSTDHFPPVTDGPVSPWRPGVMTVNGHNTYLPGHDNQWILCDTYPQGSRREQTPYLYHLPQAVLAVIVMTAVFGLVRIAPLLHAWKADRAGGLSAK